MLVTKSIIDQYTTYIDNSEMIIEYYKNKKTTGLEKYFLQIEDWLNSDIPSNQNKPLVIEADEGIGKKTLLVQWMEYHQQKSQKKFKDIIIPHFAGTGGNNSNYYYAIYKILIKLRECFNISQKVELLEDKLRRYFLYWLNVCSNALGSRVVDDSTIILVFEGINLFTDFDTGTESNVALWLPNVFPDRIRVIVTCESGSDSMQHFAANQAEIIKIVTEPILHTKLIEDVLARPSYVDQSHADKIMTILKSKQQEVLKSSLFVKTYLATMMPYPSDKINKETDVSKDDFMRVYKNLDYSKLDGINDINSLNEFAVDFYSGICDIEKYEKTLIALTITEKGLSMNEIEMLTKISTQEWNSIVAVFRTFLMKYKNLWKINNESFKKAVKKRFMIDPKRVKEIHLEISQSFVDTPNSIRRLEEQTYHLFMAEAYFKLKESVADIENFLLLFNPNNKYDLCRYWQVLEQQGFDPTSEYNKSIEGFELRYRPDPEDTFVIILQVSRFLKEFSDFETGFTPEFRHPPIKGSKELKEIGLRHEIKKMNMYVPEDWDEDEEQDEIEELENELKKEFPDVNKEGLKQFASQIYASLKGPKKKKTTNPKDKSPRRDKEKEKSKDQSTTEILANMAADRKASFLEFIQRQKQKRFAQMILSDVEALNIDIPENREQFREYFKKLGKLELKLSKRNQSSNQIYMDIDPENPDENNENDHPFDMDAFMEEQFQLARTTELQTTFYYYKRWLWVMFPWVCLSYKNNYSQIISECYSSATKYMSVQDERSKTMQALKIAIEARLQKISVYSKENNITNNTNTLKNSKSKKLNPIISNRTNTTESLDLNSLIDAKKRLAIETQSPKMADIRLPATTKTGKVKEFFVTQELLNPLGTSFISGKDIYEGKNTPQNESTVLGMSLISKNKAPKELKDSFMNLSSKRVQSLIKNASDLTANLSILRGQDNVSLYSTKQVEELERTVNHLQRELDDIAYNNKILAKKLKEMKILEVNLEAGGAGSSVTKLQSQQSQLGESQIKAENSSVDSNKQGKRLTTIMNLCENNKKNDQLWIRSLNYLLQNIKKMISWEEKNMRADNIKIEELLNVKKQYESALKEKEKNQMRLLQHIGDQRIRKEKINHQLEDVYLNVEKSAATTAERMMTNSPAKLNQKIAMNEQNEKKKNLMENKEELENTIAKIDNVIGLDFETPEFEQFIDGIAKSNDLQRALLEKEQEISQRKDIIEYKKGYLETLKKAAGSAIKETVQETPYDNITQKEELANILNNMKNEKEKSLIQIQRSEKTVLDTKLVIANIYKKLGIDVEVHHFDENLPHDTDILARLEEKLKVIKESISPEDYELFEKGQYDVMYHQPVQRKDINSGSMSGRLANEEEQSLPYSPRFALFKKGGKIYEYDKGAINRGDLW